MPRIRSCKFTSAQFVPPVTSNLVFTIQGVSKLDGQMCRMKKSLSVRRVLARLFSEAAKVTEIEVTLSLKCVRCDKDVEIRRAMETDGI